MESFGIEVLKDFGITLIHPTKAAELAFGSIPIAVVVAVFSRELPLGNLIDDLYLSDHLHGERQWCLPATGRMFLVL